MFTSYRYEPLTRELSQTQSQAETQLSANNESPPFLISLTALLETLQIFGSTDNKDRYSSRTDTSYTSGIHSSRPGGILGGSSAFDTRVLGMTGLCRLSYDGPGSPLSITLEEGNVTTTCELMTYEPETMMGSRTTDGEEDYDIPFDRNSLTQKVIMRAPLLHDAIAELATTTPDRLTIVSSPKAPYFSLSATGPLGSTTVDFNKDAGTVTQKEGIPTPQLLETFQVSGHRVVNTYKFGMIRAAAKAMQAAEKVSIRTDVQGVLSLQFMVQLDTGHVTFVDFKIVPFIPEDGEEDDDDDEEDADVEQSTVGVE